MADQPLPREARTCPNCWGSGQVQDPDNMGDPTDTNPCPDCGGSGLTPPIEPEAEPLTAEELARIPIGTSEGRRRINAELARLVVIANRLTRERDEWHRKANQLYVESKQLSEMITVANALSDLVDERPHTFDAWLDYGVARGFCTEQFCSTHGGTPMHPSEEAAWEEGYDPCCHVVRLGQIEDWVYPDV